jgi:catechol 2,3-dioxygenase-like lactoylglutathione lyase family enzyme
MLTNAELHHVGLRVRPDVAEDTISFYQGFIGFHADPARRSTPEFPGAWLDTANDTQVHLLGVEGTSRFAKAPDQDPASPHIALGVPDIDAAKAELTDAGIAWFSMGSGPTDQVFLHDPGGNMIEVHQADLCRCKRSRREDRAPVRPRRARTEGEG